MDKYSYLSNADTSYIDQLYQSYKQDPTAVDATWQKFFEGYDLSSQRYGDNGHGSELPMHLILRRLYVRTLIFAYRSFGHLKSNTNPVRERRDHGVQSGSYQIWP